MGSEGKEERPKARLNPFTPFCPIAFHLQASPSGHGCPRLPWSVGDLVSTSKMLTVSSQCPVFSGWQKRGGVMLLLRISHPAPPAPSQVAQYFIACWASRLAIVGFQAPTAEVESSSQPQALPRHCPPAWLGSCIVLKSKELRIGGQYCAILRDYSNVYSPSI